MIKAHFKTWLGGTVAVVALLAASQADAGWRHHGSSGGSWGSCGSSGGSWGSSGGSWGSSGGSWGSSGGSCGSSGGSWGSSGGSWGSSGGSWGSSGGWSSCGSSGGHVVYYYGSCGSSGGHVIEPATPLTPSVPPTGGGTAPISPSDTGAGDGTTLFRSRDAARLTVNVPAEAKVVVNGYTTTSTGTERQYISRGLQAGAQYNYEVRAEIVRDGQTLTETKSAQLAAGANANLTFSFAKTDSEQAAAEPAATTLVVRVPADARVFLSGHETRSSGPVRQFITTKLSPGGTWDKYVIRATVERDGKLVSEEQTISLAAGEAKEVSFALESANAGEQVAAKTR